MATSKKVPGTRRLSQEELLEVLRKRSEAGLLDSQLETIDEKRSEHSEDSQAKDMAESHDL